MAHLVRGASVIGVTNRDVLDALCAALGIDAQAVVDAEAASWMSPDRRLRVPFHRVSWQAPASDADADLQSWLNLAFSWEASPQGSEFWCGVYVDIGGGRRGLADLDEVVERVRRGHRSRQVSKL